MDARIVYRARRFARCGLITAILAPVGAFAQGLELPPIRTTDDTGTPAGTFRLPANMNPGGLRADLERMWMGSETFRRQCDRLLAAPWLRVTIRRDPRSKRSYRAQTRFVREGGVIVHALVAISTNDRLIEVLAHEIEHIVEQLDAVELGRNLSSRSVSKSIDGYETRRAIEVGRAVADEVDRARTRDGGR